MLLEIVLGKWLMWWTEENVGVLKLSKTVMKLKWSEVKGSEVKGDLPWRVLWVMKWSEMNFISKLVCNICGVTILELGAVISSTCFAFPICIDTNCSWSFGFGLLSLSVFLLFHVYCFTVLCVLPSYIL